MQQTIESSADPNFGEMPWKEFPLMLFYFGSFWLTREMLRRNLNTCPQVFCNQEMNFCFWGSVSAG